MILALFNSKVFDFFVRLKMGGIDLTQSVVRQIPVPFREAWNSMVTLHGVDYTALDNHPSFNVYVETVNQVFNKYFD